MTTRDVPFAVMRLVARRRATAVVGWLAIAVTGLVPLGRLVSTSGDVAGAVTQAEIAAAELTAATGTAVDASATYLEPRYVFAVDGPYDIVGIAMGLALLALLGGAVLTGGDWRSRAVGVLFVRWRHRAWPATWQVLAWAILATTAGFVLLVAATGMLVGVAGLRGSASGIDTAGTAWVVMRSTALVLIASLVGAGAGVIVRSEVVVVLAVLVEVLVAEILMPALIAEWRSPGARLVSLVLSADDARPSAFTCDVPRCDPAVLAGSGSAWLYLSAALLAVTVVVAAAGAARRPVWS